MLRLFIENKEVELNSNTKIEFNYQTTDVDAPAAVKNAYTRTIELAGTPNNNDIFGNIWRLDFSVMENGDKHTGVNFDARKRVSFELYNNGEAIECGYMQLNSINIKKGEISYSVTLFSLLGDWFYSLMYNENGESLSLADIYYGFENESGNVFTPENEATMPIIRWDKDFIKEGWQSLAEGIYEGNKPSTWVKGCPTYSGYYDDFDSDKFLINWSSLSSSQRMSLFPIDIQHTTKNGYILGTAQREMDEWEAKDLRSLYQRPAVKLDFLMNAIVNYNSDYKVEWDEDILKSPYFKDTWICFDRLNFEEDNSVKDLVTLDVASQRYTGGSQATYLKNGGGTTLDTSDYNSPYVDINLNINTVPVNSTDKYLATSYYMRYVQNKQNKHKVVIGGYLVKVNIYENNRLYYETPYSFITSWYNGAYGLSLEDSYKGYKELIEDNLGIVIDDVATQYFTLEYDQSSMTYKFNEPMKYKLKLPSTTNCKIQLVVQKFCIDEYGNSFDFGDMEGYFGSDFYGNPIQTNGAILSIEGSGYYDGNINPQIQKEFVTKKVLFGAKATPYDYLMSYIKLFNFKFETDIPNKSIKIKLRQNYYENEVVNINEMIDRDTLSITPTLINNKFYNYMLSCGDTYASLLYKKRNKNEYGSYQFSTPYNFSNSTSEVFAGNVYAQTIPFQQSSIFYNDMFDDRPAFTLAPTYEYTLYKGDGESEDFKKNGYTANNRLNKVYDSMAKVCMFDQSNNNAGIAQSILFFDGMCDYKTQLSDNNEAMLTLNENPCYIYSNSSSDVLKVDQVPRFWNYKSNIYDKYSHSTDFYRPNQLFSNTMENYGANTINIFDYWKYYLPSLYAKDSKAVEVTMRLTMKPIDALKKFYFFDNSIWILNKISNYNPLNEMQKCTFIKVDDINNYLTKEGLGLEEGNGEITPTPVVPTPIRDWERIGYDGEPPIVIPVTDEQFNAAVDIYDGWEQRKEDIGGDGNTEWMSNTNLVYFPKLDMSGIWGLSGAWQGCNNLIYLPELNTNDCRTFDYAFAGCSKLEAIDNLDFGGVDNGLEDSIFEGCDNLEYLVITNIGTHPECTYLDFAGAISWSYATMIESLLNLSYDRNAAGYDLCRIKLHTSVLATLSDSEVQAIREKGFILIT